MGGQLPCWSQAEREKSVARDGIISWSPARGGQRLEKPFHTSKDTTLALAALVPAGRTKKQCIDAVAYD
jgi:hypothetical protein